MTKKLPSNLKLIIAPDIRLGKVSEPVSSINKDTFDYAGGAGGYIDKYCFPFVRGRLFNTLEKDLKQYYDTQCSCINWLST